MSAEEVAHDHLVYIGLGSNLEPKIEYLRRAVRLLSRSVVIERCSAIYETAPFGYLEQPSFLNAVVKCRVALGPQELLQDLRHLELAIGRKTRARWHEREIDCDILFFDGLVLDAPNLSVPHPGVAERAFVLVPLTEVAPDLVHPVLHVPIASLLARVDTTGVTRTELQI